MNPSPSKASTLTAVYLAILILCGVAGYGWWNRIETTDPSVCRVCAAESENKTLSIYGHLLKSWDTEAEAGDLTKAYFTPYLGYPHAHEWISGYDSIPCSQPLAKTLVGYQLVAASGIRRPEDRRRYFESIMRPSDDGHRGSVMATWMAINSQISDPDRIWGPEMEGVAIPDYVRAGGLMPDPFPSPSPAPPDTVAPQEVPAR